MKCVSHQAHGERNYHVFYELLAGLPAEQKEELYLQEAESYFYLNQVSGVRMLCSKGMKWLRHHFCLSSKALCEASPNFACLLMCPLQNYAKLCSVPSLT